jgi:ABC-type antimicrobial peptide transport system permease subunit
MVVVGILRRTQDGSFSRASKEAQEKDLWSGFASYEYLRSHELTSSWPVSLIVVPVEGRKAELDAWLQENVSSETTAVQTYDEQLSRCQQDTQTMLLMFAAVESIIAIVAVIALAFVSHSFFAQRREEFGILHAMGCSHAWLVLRTIGEAASVVGVAWLVGAAVCVVGLIYMQTDVYAPIGLVLDLFNPAPWAFTLPMPLAVITVSSGLVAWMLSRLDPVAIIERR